MNSLPATQIPSSHALSQVRQMVPLAHVGSVYLFQGESQVLRLPMQELIDRFAMQGPVQVIVGGNRISFDHLPLILGEQLGSVYEIMDRILVSRAEVCYQMQDVLAALAPSPTPIVITDMLESFYEEDLALQEVSFLLQKCLRRIHELSETAPVLIGASGDPSRPSLLEALERNSDERFCFQPFADSEGIVQPRFSGM
jgi:hypothetical protein